MNSGRKRRRKNAGGRKRMTAKQIKFFGTARQRAALKNSRKRKSTRKRSNYGNSRKVRMPRSVAKARNRGTRKRRRQNVSDIITLSPFTGNPYEGEVRGMARTRNKKRRTTRARTTRRRTRRTRRASNPTTRIVYRNRGRRRNAGRRRNPAFMQGTIGKVGGILVGAVLTQLGSGMLPMQLASGIAGYVSTGALAMLLGTLARTAFKDKSFGDNVTTGGFTFLALKVVGDFAPGLAAGLPFGLRGMGQIASSGYALPLINRENSMVNFYRPGYLPPPITVAASNGMSGMRGMRGARVA